MNREILFRGKRVDNGEWIEGFINYCDFHNAKQEQFREYYIIFQDQYQYEVIPETICQYTGLTDKNGKKIFEGDIVETCENYDGIGEVWLKYEVKYNEKLSQFVLFPIIENGKYNSNNWDVLINYYHEQSREVIGNIYESKINE